MTFDYQCLNANSVLLTTSVPNIAILAVTLQTALHSWTAVQDVKGMFFIVCLQEENKEEFRRYTLNRFQGYEHSPTIAHAALAELLESHCLKM